VLEPASPAEDASQDAAPDQAPEVVRSPEPHLVALERLYTQVQRDKEAVLQREQDIAIALHRALWSAKAALETLRKAAQVARTAPMQAVREACRAVAVAQQRLATYVGVEEAARAARESRYVPRGL
jgi:hypothetical protein